MSLIYSKIQVITSSIQEQLMKKIKYGSRDKTKEKRNHVIEGLKEDGDDVCGAVLDSFSNDYLSYISELVKSIKTPQKMKTSQPVETIQIKNIKQKEKAIQVKKISINMVSKTQSKQISPKSPKSYNDLKNSTLPLKKMKQISEEHQKGQIKRQRDKSASLVYEKKEDFNPLRIGKTYNLKQHYNRYPTQEAESILFPRSKNQSTSLAYESQEGESLATRKSKKSDPQKEFLDNLDEYLHSLQSHRNIKKREKKVHRKTSCDDQDLRTLEHIYQENLKLRKKVKKYEQKIFEIEENMQTHFIHCKKQEKSYKTKINELTELLYRAVQKITQQKSEIDEMKCELRSFGRKAQDCVQKYGDQSSDQQNIHESLMKVMRPTRTSSQYKIKRKLIIPLLDKDQ